ncbi:MAG: hypothetical protein BWY43_00379 [candidate division WS2 bacterium ADurb.Bin280]|uniref:Uncharacterized protein n=1 Tax=candidate division WS2 bacterium ADurb.Bin280 TaxID=1852829 RepID=A0A1V5SF81_9BACT|nr:MAG: hypothetical protein BWY43_00379 [candidate division WS2 bacterium ADurb.Bin280]
MALKFRFGFKVGEKVGVDVKGDVANNFFESGGRFYS